MNVPPASPTSQCPPTIMRRTTLAFDSTGAAVVGAIPRHGRMVTDFADLTRRSDNRVRIGNRAVEAPELVARVAECLVGEMLSDPRARDPRALGADVGIALSYPAHYADEHVDALAAALDGIGLDRVVLIPEPVAAALWLEAARGPLRPGLILVYDLGAGLNVTMVRVAAGRVQEAIVGVPLYSSQFGGRVLDATLAEHALRGAPVLSESDGASVIDALRGRHVRASLDLVYRCSQLAGLSVTDIDCVLVVGGAAQPAVVAQVLADELAKPTFIAQNPERTIAGGAALAGRRAAATAALVGRRQYQQYHAGVRASTRALALSRRAKRRVSRAGGV
ncbi:Hsp70 family protein [Nocardia sp. CNY236]|uniref:Hsp70 family protein n=1 Tax=Nocardia sp. CNY236 TaxID=1169152 RepID=UPI0018CBEAD4|nr:Hsp70 family protein [Nocardia sp. CNY236]